MFPVANLPGMAVWQHGGPLRRVWQEAKVDHQLVLGFAVVMVCDCAELCRRCGSVYMAELADPTCTLLLELVVVMVLISCFFEAPVLHLRRVLLVVCLLPAGGRPQACAELEEVLWLMAAEQGLEVFVALVLLVFLDLRAGGLRLRSAGARRVAAAVWEVLRKASISTMRLSRRSSSKEFDPLTKLMNEVLGDKATMVGCQ